MKRSLAQTLALAGLTLAAATSANATVISPKFTYQGQLTSSGVLVTGTVDMTVRMFEASTGGLQIGFQNLTGVSVVDGLFTVELNRGGEFGNAAFDGNSRWLEIWVNSTPLTPRQELTVAPFAAALRPGASMKADLASAAIVTAINSSSVSDSVGLKGESAATSGVVFGVWGNARSASGAGVLGTSDVGSGSNANGVRGIGFGPAGTGVFGMATDPSGVNCAVRGNTSSSNGYAGYFTGGKNYFEGNVGLGITSPVQKLDVNGRIRVSGGVIQDDGPPITAISDMGLYSTTGHWMRFVTHNAPFVFYSDSSAGTAASPPSGSEIFVINADGSGFVDSNFGIGRPDPTFRLDVFADGGNLARFKTNDAFGCVVAFDGSGPGGGRNWSVVSSGTSNPSGAGKLIFRDVQLGVDRVAIDDTGRLGVGSMSPQAGLHVAYQPIASAGTFALEGATHTFMSFYPDGYAAGRKAYLGFGNATTNDITLQNEISGGNIRLFTGGGGRTQVSVLEILGGSDLAEAFDVSAGVGATAEQVKPGMVVCIDARNPGGLQLSSRAFDRTVAGVISGANGVNTGMMLRQEGSIADGKHPVALTGRVWCWCDAGASGAIVPGDMLTTSSSAGHAMKVADPAQAQGAIIGKAMTSLESGRGMVLVLVNLQ